MAKVNFWEALSIVSEYMPLINHVQADLAIDRSKTATPEEKRAAVDDLFDSVVDTAAALITKNNPTHGAEIAAKVAAFKALERAPVAPPPPTD